MAMQYTATLKAIVPQLVHCVYCNCKFVYEMTVTGRGCGESGAFTSDESARRTAERDARKHLDQQLNNRELCAAIPCRECYRYQPYMHKLLGQQKYDGLGCVGYLLVGVGFLVAAGATIAWLLDKTDPGKALKIGGVGLVAWVVGLVVLGWMRKLVAGYDPNADDAKERMRLAADRTMTPEDFDRVQGLRVQRTCDEHVTAARKRPRPAVGTTDEAEPLVIEWWVMPSVFLFGATIEIVLSGGDFATVEVPEDAKPGDVLEPSVSAADLVPFSVRILPLNTHPDEARVE